MNDILYALYLTWPLWAFVSVLAVALFVEEGVIAYGRRKVKDNPALQ